MARRLTLYIIIGMVLGIIVGGFLNYQYGANPDQAKDMAGYLRMASDMFLRMIKMIIAPLVFSTLVAGIAHMGDTAALGRVGVKAISWFLFASFISLSLGLLLVNLFQPGAGLHLTRDVAAAAEAASKIDPHAMDFKKFIVEIVPKSFFEAAAGNNILQIVVFSVFCGVALTAIGEKGAPLVRGVEALVDLMLQVTGYVMNFAPIAVFAALAATITTEGLGILIAYGKFVGEFYLAMALLWVILGLLAFLILGTRAGLLLRYIREPLLLAFSTASSEAAYPKTLEQLDRWGVPRRISSFVLPLGYSFNLDGSMMYATFATMFIAQAYDIHVSLGQQILILLTLMVTSKGMAGVPRASLVVIAAVLAQFNLPVEGLAVLILGVDQFLDMGRSATNVVGNAVATSVVAKWEKAIEVLEPEYVEHPHAPAFTSHHGARGLELDPENFEDHRSRGG